MTDLEMLEEAARTGKVLRYGRGVFRLKLLKLRALGFVRGSESRRTLTVTPSGRREIRRLRKRAEQSGA